MLKESVLFDGPEATLLRIALSLGFAKCFLEPALRAVSNPGMHISRNAALTKDRVTVFARVLILSFTVAQVADMEAQNVVFLVDIVQLIDCRKFATLH